MSKYHLLQKLTVRCIAGLIGAISLQCPTYAATLNTIVDNLSGGTIDIAKDTELTSWRFTNKTGVTWTDFHWFFSDSLTKLPINVNVDGVLRTEYSVYFPSGFEVPNNSSFGISGIPDPFKWTFSTGNTTIYYAPSYDVASVPEPLTILGSVAALGFGTVLKKRYSKKLEKQTV
jgi:hypothetical protein